MSKYLTRPGPLGALIDELFRAADGLSDIVLPLEDDEFTRPLDPPSDDPDAESIARILWHVVVAGYGHVAYARELLQHEGPPPPKVPRFEDPETGVRALRQMLDWTARALPTDHPNLAVDPQVIFDRRVRTSWGQTFDLETMLEHAIVHVLRHRRQIEKVLLGGR